MLVQCEHAAHSWPSINIFQPGDVSLTCLHQRGVSFTQIRLQHAHVCMCAYAQWNVSWSWKSHQTVKVYEWNPEAPQNAINDEPFYRLGNNNKTWRKKKKGICSQKHTNVKQTASWIAQLIELSWNILLIEPFSTKKYARSTGTSIPCPPNLPNLIKL